ncbi:MAG: MFS transporter [Candidatus Binatia bacterium]
MSDRVLSGRFLRITLVNFFFFLSFTAYFLLPLHLRELGAGEAVIGAVMGTAGLASIVALPIVGMTIDRWGRRAFLIGGILGFALCSFGFQLIDALGGPMYALRVLQGFSFSAGFTATTTLAAEFAPPRRRAQALGLFGASTMITNAVAAGIGEELVRRYGFSALFAGSAFTALLSVALAIPLRDENVASRRTATAAERRLHTAHWVLAVVMALLGLGFGAVVTFMPTFITGEAFGRIGLFSAAFAGSAVLSRLIGAGISDAFGRLTVVVPALVVLAAAIFCFGSVGGMPSLLAAAAVFGLAQGITYPTLHALVVDLAGEAQLGRSQALFNGAFNLGIAASAFLFGFVAEALGYRPMFRMAAFMPLLAIPLLALGTWRVPSAAKS